MSPPVLPYVYKLSNPKTGEFYFGYRFKNKVKAELDLGIKYFTSSKIVKPRFSEFTAEIIAEFFNASDAYELEQTLIAESISSKLCLNRHYHKNGSNHFAQKSPHNNKTKEKIGIAAKGRPRSPQWIAKQREAKLGKKHSIETREKMSESRKGKIKTPEHLAKISASLKGSGNMNKAIAVRAELQKKPCTVDGIVVYPSLKDLSAALGYGKAGSRSPHLKFL